jgi:hypothetical protein
VYRVSSPAFFAGQPRTSAPHVGLGFGVALATLLGCAEFDRPTFPDGAGSDSLPPEIQITAPPPADTILPTGDILNLALTVRDKSRIRDVQVSVTGVLAFAFPDIFPNDTMIGMVLPIPTPKGKTGRLEVRVEATDAFDNGSSKTFAFVVR